MTLIIIIVSINTFSIISFSIITFIIITFSIKALGIKGFHMTLSISDAQHKRHSH
jgi:hypothetical protein